MFVLRCLYLTFLAWFTPSEPEIERLVEQLASTNFPTRQAARRQLQLRVAPGCLPLAIERGCWHADPEVRRQCEVWSCLAFPLAPSKTLYDPFFENCHIVPDGNLPSIYCLAGPDMDDVCVAYPEGIYFGYISPREKPAKEPRPGFTDDDWIKQFCLHYHYHLARRAHAYYALVLYEHRCSEWIYNREWEREATELMVADLHQARVPRSVIVLILDEMARRGSWKPIGMPDPPARILARLRRR